MKAARFFITAFIIALAAVSCKKDNIDNGFAALKPSDFLSDKHYKSLTIEIAYVNGHAPTSQAVNHVYNFLSTYLNKPEGISITYTTVPSPGRTSYSINDIEKIEKDYRQHYTKGDKLASFIFFADAPYSGNSGNSQVLGIAYGTTSAAIFESTVEDNSGGVTQPSQYALEATVCEHEYGHLLGLVDNGTPMQSAHMDPSNPKHCNNQSCLMYYATETTDILATLTGDNIPQLDNNCIADLRANGGR